MLSLIIKDGKKVIYRGKGEGAFDIILAISEESRNDDFYMTVKRAVFLMEENDLPDTEGVREIKRELGIL